LDWKKKPHTSSSLHIIIIIIIDSTLLDASMMRAPGKERERDAAVFDKE